MGVLLEQGEAKASQAAAVIQRGMVVDHDSRLPIAPAQLSHTLRLPMTDSIILAPLMSIIGLGCTH